MLMGRNGRQAKILELVSRRAVSSQEGLAGLLRAQGIQVAQSTLSRDIRTLGLAKVQGVYRSPGQALRAAPPREDFGRTLRQLVLDSAVSGNILMVRTAPGNAHALGVALDGSAWPEVLGTVAGDDTVFVLLRNPRSGKKLLRRIEELVA
jgi:transcriptional regulator of arginine metabolism